MKVLALNLRHYVERADRTRVIIDVSTLAWFLFGLAYFALGRPQTATLDFAVALAIWILAVASPPLSRCLMVHGVATLCTTGLAVAALTSGQQEAMATWYLIAVPLFVAYATDARTAVAWTVIVIAVGTAVGLSPLWYEVEPEFVVQGAELWMGQLGLIALVGVLVALVKLAWDQQRTDLHEALNDLEGRRSRLQATLQSLREARANRSLADGRIASLLGALHAGVLVVDERETIVHANRAAGKIFDRRYLVGARLSELFGTQVSNGFEAGRVHREDGRVFDVTRQGLPDSTDVLIQIQDATAQVEAMSSLRLQAETDELTGLLNRRALHQKLKSMAREDESFAAVFIDLDRFKEINDEHGHEVGDGVLERVAHRVQSVFRPRDVVARLGGDEFVALLRDVTPATAPAASIQQLIDAISAPMKFGEQVVSVGCSVGVAFYPHTDLDPMLVLRSADEAMYASKRRGRGRWTTQLDDGFRTARPRMVTPI